MSDNQPDWDKITEGKIRHGIAVEAFSNGMELNADNMKKIEQWVQFVIHGYDGIKKIVDERKKESKPLTKQETVDEVKEKFDGEELDTDKYIEEAIHKAVDGLKTQYKNKVLYQLRNGGITTDNLTASLARIEELKNS
jgi:hypothetical protein